MQNNNFRDTKKNGARISSSTKNFGSDNAKRVPKNVSRFGRLNLRAEPLKNTFDLQTPDGKAKNKRVISGGRRSSPRPWSAYGPNIRKARGRNDLARPRFDIRVEKNGYAWWYIDGISKDGTKAISIIGFIGSVFSPWYYWAGRKNPQDHACINVALYGKGWRWTMTERGQKQLHQTPDLLKVGPSSFSWEKDHLVITFDEYSIPHFDRVQGTVKIFPEYISDIECNLLPDDSHIWRPFAPTSRIEVKINRPGWNWNGHGYFDANFGTNALEKDFSYWTWGRFPTSAGSIEFYDAIPSNSNPVNLALHFKKNGQVEQIKAPPIAPMRRSLWLVKRNTRSDADFKPRQVKHMLDTPFYTRSAVETSIMGERVIGVHEALDLNRFANPALKPLLAVKAPRYTLGKTN